MHVVCVCVYGGGVIARPNHSVLTAMFFIIYISVLCLIHVFWFDFRNMRFPAQGQGELVDLFFTSLSRLFQLI